MKLSTAKRKLTTWSKTWWDKQDEEDQEFRSFDWDVGSYFKKQVDKREFVTPEIDSFDKRDITSFNRTVIEKLKQENPDMADAIDEAASKIPTYYQYNLQNMYLNTPDVRRIEEVTDENRWQMRMLENMDNYYMKGVTYNSKLNSTIFTSELMGQMVMLAAKRKDKDTEKMMQEMGGGDGSGKDQGQGQSGSSGMSGKAKQKLQDAMDKAEKRAEDMMKDIKDASDLGLDPKDHNEGTSGKGAGKSSGDLTVQTAQQILEMKRLLAVTSLPKEGIMNFIKEVIKRGTSYFSSQYTASEEEFLESESDDLLNIEELLPIFKLVNLDDIVVEERKYHLTFDVYVDMSGSMGTDVPLVPGKKSRGWHSSYDEYDKDYVTAYTLSKVCALKMHQLGLVNEFYLFDTRVVPMKRNKMKFIKTSSGGGTTIDNVIRNIKQTGNPSIIITDAGDWVQEYDEKAYFLTIAGGHLGRHGSSGGNRFYANKQVSAFEAGKFFVPADGDDHSRILTETHA